MRVFWLLGVMFAIVGAKIHAQSAEEPVPQALLTERDAYYLLPPQLVCSGMVASYAWSPAGRYLVAFQMPAPGSKRAATEPRRSFLYDTANDKSIVVSKLEPGSATMESVSWNDTGESFWLLRYSRSEMMSSLALVDVSGRTLATFAESGETAPSLVSSVRGVSLVALYHDGQVSQVVLVDAKGNQNRVTLPPDINRVVELSPDGKRVVVIRYVKNPDGKGQLVWLSVDLASGVVRKMTPNDLTQETEATGEEKPKKTYFLNRPEEGGSPGEPGMLSLSRRDLRKGAPSLWIPVTPNLESRGTIDPTEKAIAYVAEGCLFVRRIERMSLEQYSQALEGENRRQAINRAKQVALAMIMYANDFDDVLPPSTNWQDIVMPYIRSSSIMADFNYTYSGVLDMSKVENPASTELGYIDVNGGRVVAYLDGHVQFVKN